MLYISPILSLERLTEIYLCNEDFSLSLDLMPSVTSSFFLGGEGGGGGGGFVILNF